jgi:hypothetical protein
MSDEAQTELKRTFFFAGAGAAILVVMIGLVMHILKIRLSDYLVPCFFHSLTGYYCPGCGGTRAVRLLAQGKVLDSLIHHPIVLYAAVLYVLFMCSNAVELLTRGRLAVGMRYRDGYLWGALVVLLLNFIVKNALLFLFGIALID